MSTDFDVCCDKCRLAMHVGQRYASGGYSFGYSSKDDAGRAFVARFTFEHAYHGPVRIVVSDTTEHKPSDDYLRLHADEPENFERAMAAAAQALAGQQKAAEDTPRALTETEQAAKRGEPCGSCGHPFTHHHYGHWPCSHNCQGCDSRCDPSGHAPDCPGCRCKIYTAASVVAASPPCVCGVPELATIHRADCPALEKRTSTHG